jgi:crotonobetainyl-CoA:carnitine CoA-transferase CaiB-like acyl-CoA transferase
MSSNAPLEGIRVLEFGHMVMGPSCGMILADLGAEVIKVEPQGKGDKTRYLGSFGTGFHSVFNRNKKSLAVDIKSVEGKALILELVKSADVVTENFREGTLDRAGLGYEELKKHNSELIYCSMKGFLSGPYENRAALDEVVQMMGGLAYMTGPEGKPSRAGASVNDIMGGMFGVIGILAAINQKQNTGKGSIVKSGLFENCALLMATHIATHEISGLPSKSLFTRDSQPWPVYDLFWTGSKTQIFVGLVTDGQWDKFCEEFELDDFKTDSALQSNEDRVIGRDLIIPRLESLFGSMDADTVNKRLDHVGCPFAPVAKPEDLLDDEHLNASNGFVDIELRPGLMGKLPKIPLQYNGQRLELRIQPPRVGEHSRELISSIGHDDNFVNDLIAKGVVSEELP